MTLVLRRSRHIRKENLPQATYLYLPDHLGKSKLKSYQVKSSSYRNIDYFLKLES